MLRMIKTSDKNFDRIALGAVALMLVFCFGMVLYYDGPKRPYLVANRNIMHVYGAGLTGFLLLLHAWWQGSRALPRWATWGYFGLITAILLTMGGTTMISNGISKGVMLMHRHDTYHYLLGPKYYPELQYDYLYKCTVAADYESMKPAFGPEDKIRDLDDYYSMRIMDRGGEWAKICKDRFAPARWEKFKTDIELYKKIGDIKKYVRDMGYNGSPFHAYVLGTIANSFALTAESIRYATLIDMTMICGGIALIIWAAGWQIGILAGIYFFTFVGDRFYIIGNSFGRYVWWFLLILSICMLIKKRWFAGGFAMMLSAMMTVFPGVFFGGLGLMGLREWVTTRRLPKNYLRMAIGALAGLAFSLTLGSMHGEGFKNFENHFEKVKAHSEPMTSKRVNLRFLFFAQDESLNQELSIIGNREAVYDTMKPYVFAAILLFIILAAGALLAYVRDAATGAMFMGVALMLSVTPIVCYYFSISLLLVVLFYEAINGRMAKTLLSAMFFGMSYMVWLTVNLAGEMSDGELDAFVLNHVLTTYLLLTLLAIMMYFHFKAPERRLTLPPHARRP